LIIILSDLQALNLNYCTSPKLFPARYMFYRYEVAAVVDMRKLASMASEPQMLG
jgi:hypothetical protein